MARTISSLLVGMLRDKSVVGEREDVSQGELFAHAQRRGYDGTQDNLLAIADRLVAHGVLVSAPKGMNDCIYYAINGELK